MDEPVPHAPVLHIVVGSTRPGRVGLPVARWVAEQARARGGFAVELVDLAEVALPLLDEPHHPRLQQYVHAHTKEWSATVDRAAAFVFVTPEYNHSVPAPLKNALDYLNAEWRHKPVGIVSYGGVAGGVRAATALEPALAVLKMPVAAVVPVPFVATMLAGEGDDRRFTGTEPVAEGLAAMLDELARWESATRPLRAG